jgi:purine-nucleoside phosphorylase
MIMNREKLFEYCFGCRPGNFPETMIITPFLPVENFTEHCESGRSFKGRLYSGQIAIKNGQEFAVVHCGMGSAFAGDAILLLDITPVQKIFFTGSCGGLKNCRIGDLIICESAFDGEGFTRYHTGGFDIKTIFNSGAFIPAGAGYIEKLRGFLPGQVREGIFLRTGDIFTIGSLMAEKQENVLGIAEKGFKGIDMELSAVYHAARATNREAAALLFVSDLPLEKPLWEERTTQERNGYNTGMKEMIRLSVEFVSTSF